MGVNNYNMDNWEKVSLVLGILLMVIGISLIIEGQILGERTIPASIALTLVGMTLTLAARQKK